MKRVILASDFHLSGDRPEELAVFESFCADVVSGADVFYVLGDLFNFWVGPRQIHTPGMERVFDALKGLSGQGTRVVLFHGNRDFLLGQTEAVRAGAEVVGEELPVELFGQNLLLLHGDSLCTHDVGYQRSKPLLRSGFVRVLSRLLPLSLALKVAGGIRGVSRRSVMEKKREEMEIVKEAVERRFQENYDALICGHVHAPGKRDYGSSASPVFVLGDWHGGGVYGVVDEKGPRLETYQA